MLEDTVEFEEDVWLVVETTLEDVVDETEDDAPLVVEVEIEPLEPKTMPTPPAIATMATIATTAAILPIPLREVFVIDSEDKRCRIFKTSQG